jgi:hypothetical protein
MGMGTENVWLSRVFVSLKKLTVAQTWFLKWANFRSFDVAILEKCFSVFTVAKNFWRERRLGRSWASVPSILVSSISENRSPEIRLILQYNSNSQKSKKQKRLYNNWSNPAMLSFEKLFYFKNKTHLLIIRLQLSLLWVSCSHLIFVLFCLANGNILTKHHRKKLLYLTKKRWFVV